MSSETEGQEFAGLEEEEDLSAFEEEEEPPEPQRPPRERRGAKPGPKPKTKAKKPAPAEEEPAEGAEKPPLTEDELGLVEVMAVMPLVVASQLLSTPQKPIVFHNESIREVKIAARKYAKYIHRTTDFNLTPGKALLLVYAAAIGGAYLSQARKDPPTPGERPGPRPVPNAGKPGAKRPKEYEATPRGRDDGGVVHVANQLG